VLTALTLFAVFAVGVSPVELFSVGLRPVDVGAATPSKARSAAACVGCHEGAHTEWSASRHRAAWTNPIFQREYRDRPLAWCVHCHAPLVEQKAEIAARGHDGGPLAAEGVSCAACHLRNGETLAARKRPGSPHKTRVVDGFGGPAFCGGCHQFNYPRFDGARPDEVVGYTDHPMQATIAEHRAGPDGARACVSCHAPAGPDGAVGHRYPGAHDPDMLARAISVEACVPPGGGLRVVVENRGAGHRAPTGDVHRHLVLRAWRPSAPERLWERIFGRRFTPAAPPDEGKVVVEDTTLAPRERRAFAIDAGALGEALSFDDAPRVELRYVFVIDEIPVPERALAEPAFTVVYRNDRPAPCR
jgi:hypothetical protein